MVTWLPAMRMPAPLRPMLPTKEQPKKVAVLANTSMAWLMAVRWLKVEFANEACDTASRDEHTHTHTCSVRLRVPQQLNTPTSSVMARDTG